MEAKDIKTEQDALKYVMKYGKFYENQEPAYGIFFEEMTLFAYDPRDLVKKICKRLNILVK